MSDFDRMWMGKKVDFYGVDNNTFCVGRTKKGGKPQRAAFEAVEDECDGYRSMLKELRPVPIKGHVFLLRPVAKVVIGLSKELDGYELRDPKTKHVWLQAGTDASDDYYPIFVFRYTPSLVPR